VAWHPASPTPGMRASVDDACIAGIAALTPAGGSANPGTWSHSHASFAALEAAARCSTGRSTAGWGACARRENLVVCGPSGTGKTFLLEALGQQAAGAGLKVAWFTLEDLGVLLRRHRADDTVSKAIARVLRADLAVVDDIGLLPVAQDAAEGLYRLARPPATLSGCPRHSPGRG
jgi:IstB-like ATP binding protein